MEDYVFFGMFAAACLGMFGWGLTKPERTYQFPFLASCICVGLLLPEAYGLLGDQRLPDGAFALTMTMGTLCVLAIAAPGLYATWRAKAQRARRLSCDWAR